MLKTTDDYQPAPEDKAAQLDIVPVRAAGHQVWVERNKAQIQDAFLEQYAKSGNVLLACHTVAITRVTVYKWRREDPEFAQRMQYSREDSTDVVEAKLRQEAVNGNVTAMIVYLKAKRPEEYSERHDYFVSQRFRGKTDEELRFLLAERLGQSGTSRAGGAAFPTGLPDEEDDGM